MPECRSCGATFPPGRIRCDFCGARLEGPGAGAEEPETARPDDRDRDGADPAGRRWSRRQRAADTQPPHGEYVPLNLFAPPRRKSYLLAGLLALVFGTFGIHWYYLGDPRRARWYWMFFWTGIPTLVGVVESAVFFWRSGREFFIY